MSLSHGLNWERERFLTGWAKPSQSVICPERMGSASRNGDVFGEQVHPCLCRPLRVQLPLETTWVVWSRVSLYLEHHPGNQTCQWTTSTTMFPAWSDIRNLVQPQTPWNRDKPLSFSRPQSSGPNTIVDCNIKLKVYYVAIANLAAEGMLVCRWWKTYRPVQDSLPMSPCGDALARGGWTERLVPF